MACVVSLVAGTILLRTALCVVRDLAGAAGRGISLADAAPLGLLGSLLIRAVCWRCCSRARPALLQ
ncbi:MAG: hypothetical protein IPH51_12830 [Rubrivivax sp.]|nr:hypothetical protein [Rubrivivax sp.]